MVSPSDLKPDRVLRAFERAGWANLGRKGDHFKLKKEGNPNILSLPVHKGRTLKKGLALALIKLAGLTWEEFERFYR